MLTKTANELIGKRVRVLHNPPHPEFEGQIGRVDQVVLFGDSGTVRVLIAGKPVFAEMPLDAIEYRTCGYGEGCSLCAEKPAEVGGESASTLRYGVYRWLGIYRDHLDREAVQNLQDVLGPLNPQSESGQLTLNAPERDAETTT